MLRVISLGAGVQSTTMALMAARGNAEPYRVGVETILGCSILGLLFGLGLSIFGWKNFYNRRRLRGAAMVCGGWLLGLFSLVSIWWWPL